MVTLRACRMLNATASTSQCQDPSGLGPSCNPISALSLMACRLETNMPLKADRNNPGDIQRTGRPITGVRQTARMQKGFYAAAK